MTVEEDDVVTVEKYILEGSDFDTEIVAEYISRDDWDGMPDPCPECEGTEFDYIGYEGGHYGQHEETVVERQDYWDEKGSLYTACRDCEEILFKHPAYDIVESWTEEVDAL